MPLPALLSLLLAGGPVLQGEARRDCAPWDGPAFTLMLPAPGVGGSRDLSLRISIWQAPAIRTPRTLPLPVGAKLGGAVLQPPRGQVQLLQGSVTIDKGVPEAPVQGQFDLTTPQGVRYRGRFRAPWDGGVQARCG
jgi:hypothetical protein